MKNILKFKFLIQLHVSYILYKLNNGCGGGELVTLCKNAWEKQLVVFFGKLNKDGVRLKKELGKDCNSPTLVNFGNWSKYFETFYQFYIVSCFLDEWKFLNPWKITDFGQKEDLYFFGIAFQLREVPENTHASYVFVNLYPPRDESIILTSSLTSDADSW